MRRPSLSTLALGTVIIVAGCGGSTKKESSSSTTAGPSLKTVTVDEQHFKLTPGAINVSEPGTYTFKGVNKGTIGHALELEGQGVEGRTATISPGSSATLTVHLSKAGSYELYCPIDGHKGMGMKADVTVGGSSGSGGGTSTTDTSTDTGSSYSY
jgi:plastocyanin